MIIELGVIAEIRLVDKSKKRKGNTSVKIQTASPPVDPYGFEP